MSENEAVNAANPVDQNALADEWAAALQQQQHAADKLAGNAIPPMDPHEGHTGEKLRDINLDVILDVPVTIAIEVGRKRLNIRNLLQLTQGSLIELDRLQGEPMDVLVNGTLVAHGEVVVVNDKFGVRLTDVLSPSERVKKLK
jgi:flagellar motor switch protein FliN/FliY